MKRLIFAMAALGLALAVVVLASGRDAVANHIPYASGDVFGGVGTGFIKHYDSSGALLETLDTGTTCGEQLGMGFDASGNLYATSSFGACSGAGEVVKFDNMGGLIGPFGGPYSTSTDSIAIDAAGNVYVGQPDGTKDLLKFDSAGNPVGSFDVATEARGSDWIDLSADQCTMLYTSEGSRVLRYDVCADTQLTDFATGLVSPCFALRIRANGEVMVACASRVYRLDAAGSTIQTYTTGSVSESSFFFALNLDPDGSSFWTAGYFSGDIHRIDIASGTEMTSFNAGILGCCLSGLAIAGEPVVAIPECLDHEGNLLRWCLERDVVQPGPPPTPAPTPTPHTAPIRWSR